MNTHAARLLCFLFTILASASHAEETIIRFHGSTTWAKLLTLDKLATIERTCGVRLEVGGSGSGRGLRALASGEADIASISGPLDPLARWFEREYGTPFDLSSRAVTTITHQKVALIVHGRNPVRALTLSQAQQLLTGTVKTWREIGGNDEPVVIVVPFPGDGARLAIEQEILSPETPLTPTARVMRVATEVPYAVAQLPGAMGIVTMAHVRGDTPTLTFGKEIEVSLAVVTHTPRPEPVRCIVDALTEMFRGDRG
jgi:phosphate transport system substrate-binding protein